MRNFFVPNLFVKYFFNPQVVCPLSTLVPSALWAAKFFGLQALWSSQNVFGPPTASCVVVDFKDRAFGSQSESFGIMGYIDQIRGWNQYFCTNFTMCVSLKRLQLKIYNESALSVISQIGTKILLELTQILQHKLCDTDVRPLRLHSVIVKADFLFQNHCSTLA